MPSRIGSPALSREQAEQALAYDRLPVQYVRAAVPYTNGKVEATVTVRHLTDGRAIIAIGEWPFTKHADVDPAALIDALSKQEPAHGA